jgi:Cdc6-like AAA superfamily ATPase
VLDQFDNERKILQKMQQEDTPDKLLTILKQIPSLDINLSPLQESVVTAKDNLLCLGRSGTGKTTSSVLRLFS